MRKRLLLALLAAAVLAPAAPAYAGARFVASGRTFQKAVADFRQTGGRIVLLPGDYRRPLVVGPRSNSVLDIVGTDGARVQSLRIARSRDVIVRGLVVRPLTGDARVMVKRSRGIVFRGDTFTAKGTEFKVGLRLDHSQGVVVRSSTFSHCGDHTPKWSTCLLPRWARDVRIVRNWFHDCRGCDFVHGLFGYDLTLRGNRFERALPCRMDHERCGHQDLVSFWSGNRLLVERNSFGVYRVGAAQLYLVRGVDRVSIVNNVFRGTDPRVPGYHSRVAIIVGSKGSKRVPRRVRIVNNTILTGARRIDGYAGSIRMSGVYWGLQRRKRPLLANNVIGLVQDPHHICSVAGRAVENVVLRGVACRGHNRVGRVHLDRRGRPTAASTLLIDRGSRGFGTRQDIDGRPRDLRPDIGAYEYRGPKRTG